MKDFRISLRGAPFIGMPESKKKALEMKEELPKVRTVINFTTEGIIVDMISEGDGEEEVIDTSSRTYNEILWELDEDTLEHIKNEARETIENRD